MGKEDAFIFDLTDIGPPARQMFLDVKAEAGRRFDFSINCCNSGPSSNEPKIVFWGSHLVIEEFAHLGLPSSENARRLLHLGAFSLP